MLITKIALKRVLEAVEALPDESPEGALRFVILGCRRNIRDGGIRWGAREPANPPANSWKGDPSNITVTGSDMRNRAVTVIMDDGRPDIVSVTLWGVWLCWEDVVRLRPELGKTPPSAVKIAAPLRVEIVGGVRVAIESVTTRLKTLFTRVVERLPRIGSAKWWLNELPEEAWRGLTGKEIHELAAKEAAKRNEAAVQKAHRQGDRTPKPLSVPDARAFQDAVRQRRMRS